MLKHLNFEEMVGLTRPWVDATAHQPVFLSIAEIAALHPQVVELQALLLAAQPSETELSVQLSAVVEQATEADVRHDALARAISGVLDADRLVALAAEPPDHERAERVEAVQAELFPDGLSIVNASLLAESGNTERVATVIERPEVDDVLQQIPVRDGNLLQLTTRWVDAGRQLGQLEHQRAELLAEQAATDTEPRTLHLLRNEWLRLVSLVLANLALSRADAAAIETIRGPVLEASARAGRRYASPSGAQGGEAAREAGEPSEPAPSESF